MKDFLLKGETPIDYQSFYNESGSQNVQNLLSTLEIINHVIEYPMRSMYWLDFTNARHDGIYPKTFKLPSIIDKYFSMSLKEFLTDSVNEKVFKDFEDECLQSCVMLDRDQVFNAHNEALYMYHLTKDKLAE